MDDTQLVLRLVADLDGSFETLVRTHVDRCHAIALRVLGNPHDAEEVTQDTLVRAYRALATYDAERIRELRLRPWLTTIVLNLCRNRARRAVLPSTSMAPLVEAGWEPVAKASDEPAAVADRRAGTARLAVQLAALPDRYRIPVVLRHVDNLSSAELAEVLGRPEGTLKAQVHRGLALLRASLTAADVEELTA